MAGYLSVISRAVQDGDHNKVVQTVEAALKDSMPANDILEKGLVPGIQALGERFKDGEVFLPEVLISARAMNRGVEVIKPYFAEEEAKPRGTVVLGTIEGDLHDIGKNLVKMMLECNRFHVVDLGIDVPAASFASAAREHKADIVAVSSLLTVTMVNMPGVIEALEESGLKDKVPVMVGGAPLTREFADSIGAEGFAEDCASAVDEANRLMMTE
jgi:5-methyltetrahydrofolate--homocysteine methyltransferase